MSTKTAFRALTRVSICLALTATCLNLAAAAKGRQRRIHEHKSQSRSAHNHQSARKCIWRVLRVTYQPAALPPKTIVASPNPTIRVGTATYPSTGGVPPQHVEIAIALRSTGDTDIQVETSPENIPVNLELPDSRPLEIEVQAAQDLEVPLPLGRNEIAVAGNLLLSPPNNQEGTFRWAPLVGNHGQWGIDVAALHPHRQKTIGSGDLLANFYFGDTRYTRTNPYIGAAIGQTFGRGSRSIYGVQAGVKHFLQSHVALFGEVQWRDSRAFVHQPGGTEDNTHLLLGISYFK